MPGLQEWIHWIEEGRGARMVRWLVAVLGFIALALLYDGRAYKNFATEEAMDAAQLARNLAEGQGYTTDFIRPLSLHLLKEHRDDHDPLLKTAHPDLANPPAYPVLLAALLKIIPLNYEMSGPFSTYEPERWIAGLNQLLFLAAIVSVFLLAKRLFDRSVAVVSTLAFATSELFWRFSTSGLPILLLINIVLGVAWCVVKLEQLQRDENASARRVYFFSGLAGLLIGLAALTRYSFLWLIIPALLFVVFLDARFRMGAGVAMAAVFLLAITPWVTRNVVVSGTPFGTSGYAIFEMTAPFPENSLQRSLNPEPGLNKLTLNNFARKLVTHFGTILQKDLPRMGGSWFGAFCLVGLLLPFRNVSISRLRLFLILAIGLFAMVQSLGRTHLSEASPEINSENLLPVFAPMVFMFGASFFFVLLDQFEIPLIAVRRALTGFLVALIALPLLLAIAPFQLPYAYPPYFPPTIQTAAYTMQPDELTMSDIPAAVAWYGDRKCVGLTLDYDEQFFAIHEKMKPVQALLLSPRIMEQPFLTQIFRPSVGNKRTWERFFYTSLAYGEVMSGFPLRKSRLDLLQFGYLFLSDRDRWNAP